eukprot:gene8270-15116_t
MSAAELAAITGLPEANAASLLAAHGGDANAALSAHLDTLDASGSASPGPGAGGAGVGEDSTTSVTDKLFAKAREAGPPREDPADAVTPAFVPFGGAGRSLSKDSTPDTAKSSSSSGGGGAKENESAAEEERIVKIKLGFFRNGFLVDDDHFFKSSGAEYDKILKDLEGGMVPPQIARLYVDGQNRANIKFEINLMDKREEQYNPPPPTLKSFSGRTLGSDHLVRRGTGNGTGAGSNAGGSSNSATPGSGRRGGGVNGDNGDGATVLAFGNGFAAGGGVASGSGGGAAAASETAAGAAVVLPVADESRPTTKISFKLANGGGTEQYTFNVSHTLADVYAVAAHLTSLSSSSESSGGGGAGVLFGGYPPKPLANDGGITIEDAQIQGAALRQKLSPPPSKAKSE